MNAPKSLVIDLTKCQWATLYYKSNTGYTSPTKPVFPTVQGSTFIPSARHLAGGCTLLEYAIQYRLLDVWHPMCTFQLSANHCVTYTGDKAISMYDAWRAKIFSKTLKKK